MKPINKIIFIIIILFIYNHAFSWEIYDKVIATVNETPLIESEIIFKFERMIGQKKMVPNKLSYEKSRLLDKFIEEALVEQTAKQESIIVSPEKIDNQIKKIMERMDVKSIDAFKRTIEKTENITFEEYRDELRKSLISEQVMSIAIGVSPPSVKEAEDWYKANKEKVGYEVNIQQIFIRLANDSYAENKRANKLAGELYNKIKSGQTFESVAKESSEDMATKNNGGNLGWLPLSNMAKKDIILANNIYNEFIVNRNKYAVVKSSTGYHIIKYNGRRTTSFEAAKEDIFNLLYQKKLIEQFKKWVSQKRQQSDIKIYMQDYIKEKSNT
jgi:putative peptidyl-prolyl cis-trans isomerase